MFCSDFVNTRQGADLSGGTGARPTSAPSLFRHRRSARVAKSKNTTCSWFITRDASASVDAHAVAVDRDSRRPPTQTRREGDSPASLAGMRCASCRSVFCLGTRFVRIAAGSMIHNSSLNPYRKGSKPARVLAGLNPRAPFRGVRSRKSYSP